MSKFSELLFVLLMPLLAAAAQDTPQPQFQPRSGESERVAGSNVSTPRQITIEVQVNDKSGAPVRGLQKQDFTLLDDKQPQKILSFRETDLAANETSDAVQVILFVDAVNTAFHNVSYKRQQIERFLQQNGGRLPLPTSLD